jgi:hypothetical protein
VERQKSDLGLKEYAAKPKRAPCGQQDHASVKDRHHRKQEPCQKAPRNAKLEGRGFPVYRYCLRSVCRLPPWNKAGMCPGINRSLTHVSNEDSPSDLLPIGGYRGRQDPTGNDECWTMSDEARDRNRVSGAKYAAKPECPCLGFFAFSACFAALALPPLKWPTHPPPGRRGKVVA